jgi:hypothetical protein
VASLNLSHSNGRTSPPRKLFWYSGLFSKPHLSSSIPANSEGYDTFKQPCNFTVEDMEMSLLQAEMQKKEKIPNSKLATYL